jgi:DNA-binding transcriptional MocR family regulator
LENPDRSDRHVAASLGVSHHTVADARKAVGQSAKLKTRKGKDGKKYPANKQGSSAAAIKAKADLAASKPPPNLFPNVMAKADRAEARTRLDVARAAYIAAIEAAGLDMVARVAEVRAIEDAIGTRPIPICNAPAKGNALKFFVRRERDNDDQQEARSPG